MGNFTASLFVFKFVFITELIVTELILSTFLKRRSNFKLRVSLSIIGLYVITFFLQTKTMTAIGLSLMFMDLFALSMVALWICFSDNFGSLLFCGIMAYTVQHFTHITSSYVSVLCGISGSSVYLDAFSNMTIKALAVNLGFYFIIYAILFVLVVYLKNKVRELRVQSIVLVITSTIMLTSSIILNSIVVYERVESSSFLLYTLFLLYDIISCVATAVLLCISIKTKNLEHENTIIKNLWEADKENYRLRKEKIETIGIMCHDLKHRLARLESERDISQLKELQEIVNKYNSFYDTGNEVIDIILTEESSYCAAHNIQFIALIEPQSLLFMEKEHLYSLLENSLHNAIEAAEEVEEQAKRYVKICVTKKNGMSFFSVENYFERDHDLIIIDGVPQTTKGDEDMHGYGYKSMTKIVNLYNGAINVNVKNDMFYLDIFFPMI